MPKKRKYSIVVEPGSLTDLVNQYETSLIAQALIETRGDASAAARLLKIKRPSFVAKRRRLGFPIGKPYRKIES